VLCWLSGLFGRKCALAPDDDPNGHGVLVRIPPSDDEFGAENERKAIFELEGRLIAAIEAAEAAEFDGNEFGGGECTLYMYGPDADALFAAVEPVLREFVPARGGCAIRPHGSVFDENAPEERVELQARRSSTMRRGQVTAVIVVVLACVACASAQELAPAQAELDSLAERVEGFQVIELPAEGDVGLRVETSLTIDDLRGVTLDDDPPVLGEPPEDLDPRMTDDWPPGEAPYVAQGIEPFRFRWFNNEFSYGGWHNWDMIDYAATRGFNIIYPYNRDPETWTEIPEGTRWLRWGGLVNWSKWLPEHGLPEGRYDQLAGMDLPGLMRREETLAYDPRFDQLMIDMEHGVLPPDRLREQKWYPPGASEAERAQFERRYYDGYAQTNIAPVEAARRNGWHDLSIYGWQPYGRRYWGLESAEVDPATDWGWNAFGRAIYEAVDILNPSVYCFYWTPRNVAYTLANIDLNMQLVRTMPERKPLRPYYWTLLHGGGGGPRWWQNQPIPDEDVRAMTAMCFFTGADGMVLWNWSGTGDHHRPHIEAGAYVMVASPFEATPEGGEAQTIDRYRVLLLDAVEEDGTVRFRVVDPEGDSSGVTDDQPVFAMARAQLEPNLRPKSAPVAAMIEGLALVRPLEYILRHGEVQVDVPAQEQFGEDLPIVRRVSLGPWHIVATYDPGCVFGGEPRTIRLEDFASHAGLTLELPADAQTRIFVLQEPQ